MNGELERLVYVVDDDEDVLAFVTRWLEAAGMEVYTFPDGESGLEALAEEVPAAICVDMNMPGLGGLATLERIREHHPLLPIIVLTADDTAHTAVQAMKLGARDYLTKPLDQTKLVTTLRNAVEFGLLANRVSQLEREADGRGYPGFIGSSPAMKAVFRQIDRLAQSDVSVLIHGESGTGKELVARAIHNSSSRGKKRFVAINSSAIPESLLESELFGHEKGSFTGAVNQRIGQFEEANGGTLFLDEIGELPANVQAKLLRVLQEKNFQRLGSSRSIQSDFRLLTATHRDLTEEVKAGRFREDLFFRLAVFELELPPLRARRGDIPALAEAFLRDPRGSTNARATRISPEALGTLMEHEWPGNVRELQNVMQRAMVVAEGDEIQPTDLPSRLRMGNPEVAATPVQPQIEKTDGSLEQTSKRLFLAALIKHEGNASAVMRELRVSRPRFYRMLRKFDLEDQMTGIRQRGKPPEN